MKIYFSFLTGLAIAGVALVFSKYSIIVAVASFGIGFLYKEFSNKEENHGN